MATHDYHCANCDLTEERTCLIAEAKKQKCSKCGKRLAQLFSPPTEIIASPKAFKYTFGELYGTSSEKDYLREKEQAGTPVERINPSTFKTRKEINEAKWAKAHKDAADIEASLRANKTLTAGASGKKKSRSA